MLAADFSTYEETPSQSDLDDLKAVGVQHLTIGMDAAPASIAIVRDILDYGFSWDAYGMIYATRDPAQSATNLRNGIIGVFQTRGMLRDLPGFAISDIEKPEGQFPSIAQIQAYVTTLLSYQIGPGYMVQQAAYTAPWVWEQAGYGNFIWPAIKGLLLWTTDSNPPFAGWTEDQVIGRQTAENVKLASGFTVDYSNFRNRGALLL